MQRLHGAIAAAVTPLTEGGLSLDSDSFGPLVRFLATGGVDGVLVAPDDPRAVAAGIDAALADLPRLSDGARRAATSWTDVATALVEVSGRSRRDRSRGSDPPIP